MVDPSTQSNSQSQSGKPLPSRSNGADIETQSTTPQPPKKLYVEDFSQHHINRGQVSINLLLTVVNERIKVALDQLESAVEKLANKQNIDATTLTGLKDAIAAVHIANKQVAGEFPPGCDPALVDRPIRPITN